MFFQGIAEGIRGVFAAGPMCILAVRKRFWLATDGKIVGVDIRNVEDPEGRRVPNYMLVYEYRVDGVQYFGVDRIPIDVPYYSELDVIKDVVAKFPPGERIEIYYPEQTPDISSARRDVVGLSKALGMAAIGLITASGLGYYFYVRGVAMNRP